MKPNRRQFSLFALPTIGGPLGAWAQSKPLVWRDLPLVDGQSLTARQLRSVPVVLSFFRTDCGYCRRNNARLSKLAKSLPADRLLVLGAALDDDLAAVRRYLADQGLAFPSTWGAQSLREGITTREVVPFTAVIDAQGQIRERIPGEMAEDDVLGLARWALAAKQP